MGTRPKQPPIPEVFRDRCRRAVDEQVLQRWIDEIEIDGPHWLEASKLLVAYGYGRPPVTVPDDATDDAGGVHIYIPHNGR